MADYLEGHLALTDRALLDAHLDACSECSAEIGEMRSTIALLRELPEPEVPGDFAQNVMRRIRAGEAKPSFFGRIGDFFESITPARVVVPASAALLSAGFVLWGQQAGLLDITLPPASAPVEKMELAQAETARPAPRLAETAATKSRADEVQLAGLGSSVASAPAAPAPAVAPELGSSAPVLRMRIALNSAPPPYQIDAARPAPVQIPLRADGLGPSPSRARSSAGRSMAVAATPATPQYGITAEAKASDPRSRDDWLAILEASPREFAARLSVLTLAEQELWIDRLARHATEQGSLDRIVERLRTAGGEEGRLLADDFSAVTHSVPD